VFFLDVGKARLLRRGQLGAAHAEVADRVVDDALARRRQGVEFGRGAQRLVLGEQRLVLAQHGPELGDLGLVLVEGGAQLGGVDHIVQVTDDAPGAAQQFGGVFQRGDKAGPAHLFGRRFQLLDHGAAAGQQRVDGGRDVFRLDLVEARQAAEVEEGIDSVSHSSS